MIEYTSDKEEVTLKLADAKPIGSFTIFGRQMVWVTTDNYKNLPLRTKKDLTMVMAALLFKDLEDCEAAEAAIHDS